jgi:hypothetical protein
VRASLCIPWHRRESRRKNPGDKIPCFTMITTLRRERRVPTTGKQRSTVVSLISRERRLFKTDLRINHCFTIPNGLQNKDALLNHHNRPAHLSSAGRCFLGNSARPLWEFSARNPDSAKCTALGRPNTRRAAQPLGLESARHGDLNAVLCAISLRAL